MKEKVKVSIIVPVYNVEIYLQKCLLSIESQTFKNIEVIVVDDGSKDKSNIIAKKICERNNNFKYIYQENMGLGGARNTGIKNSCGEYLYFLDSDDKLPKDAIENLYNAAIKSKCDIILGRPVWDYKGYYKGTYMDSLFRRGCRLLEVNKWKEVVIVTSQLINRDIFIMNNIFFPEKMTGEDVQVSLQLQNKCNGIYVIDDIVYLRTEREDENNKSITQQFNKSIVNDRLKSIENIMNIDVISKLKNNKLSRCLSTLEYIRRNLKADMKNIERIDIINNIKEFIELNQNHKKELDYIFMCVFLMNSRKFVNKKSQDIDSVIINKINTKVVYKINIKFIKIILKVFNI